MRETNINNPIDRKDVKVGDKIRVSREVLVTGVRETSIYGGSGNPSKPVTIVSTATDTIALTATEAVTLLERDREVVKIPASARFVYWQDRYGEDYYARYDADRDAWVEDDGDEYESTEKLVEYIEGHLKEGTFQVLKYHYASGGVVGGIVGGLPNTPIHLSQGAMASLRNSLVRNASIA